MYGGQVGDCGGWNGGWKGYEGGPGEILAKNLKGQAFFESPFPGGYVARKYYFKMRPSFSGGIPKYRGVY